MDNLVNEMMHNLTHQMQHAIDDAVNSPAAINRGVGEAMRHIGSVLTINSSAYLPLRPDEILVAPERFITNSDAAVVFVKRTIKSPNAFTLLVDRKTVDGKISYSLFGFNIDDFSLNKTLFIKIDDALGAELIRQLNKLINSDGTSLVQCVVLKDHFKDTKSEVDTLFSTEVDNPVVEQVVAPLKEEREVIQKSTSLLPAVNMDSLL